mgnify:CR=1 FL=1
MADYDDDDTMNAYESSDDEFFVDIVSSSNENSDNELDMNDEEIDENNYNTNDSGSEFIPQYKRKRPSRPLSSDGEDLEDEPDHVGGKIEDNLFGTWFDVTNNDIFPKIIPFTSGTQTTGPQVPDYIKEPIDYFKLFITDELINNIVTETNKYATTKINNLDLCPRSTWRSWKPVTAAEITAFIGVILNIGLLPVKNLQDCWTKEFNLQIQFYGKVFRRERFFQIFWNLHPNENVQNKDLRTRVKKVDNFLKFIE